MKDASKNVSLPRCIGNMWMNEEDDFIFIHPCHVVNVNEAVLSLWEEVNANEGEEFQVIKILQITLLRQYIAV